MARRGIVQRFVLPISCDDSSFPLRFVERRHWPSERQLPVTRWPLPVRIVDDSAFLRSSSLVAGRYEEKRSARLLRGHGPRGVLTYLVQRSETLVRHPQGPCPEIMSWHARGGGICAEGGLMPLRGADHSRQQFFVGTAATPGLLRVSLCGRRRDGYAGRTRPRGILWVDGAPREKQLSGRSNVFCDFCSAGRRMSTAAACIATDRPNVPVCACGQSVQLHPCRAAGWCGSARSRSEGRHVAGGRGAPRPAIVGRHGRIWS